MSANAEAQVLIRSLVTPGYSVKAAINSAAAKMSKHGWTWNRCKDVWQGDRRIKVSGDELLQLRRAAKLAREEYEASNELAQIKAEIARIRERLIRLDPEFYVEEAAALGVAMQCSERVASGSEREDEG